MWGIMRLMKELGIFFNRPAVKAIVNYLLGLATATFAGIFFGQISQLSLIHI